MKGKRAHVFRISRGNFDVIRPGLFHLCLALFIACVGMSFSAPPAFAQCTAPDGVESQTRFDGAMYYCNGTSWIRMDNVAGPSSLGCIVGDKAIPHNGSTPFYSAAAHTNCASISETRTCTNGVLSGSFTNPNCTNYTPITATYVGQLTSTSTALSINFGSLTVPNDGLLVIVGTVISDGAGSIASVSMGGSAGTLHVNGTNASGNWRSFVASRVITAGSRNITVTLSGAQGTANTHSVAAWVLTNYDSATPVSAAHSGDNNITSTDLVLNVPAGGVALYKSIHANANNTVWSSATENVDTSVSCCSGLVTRKHANGQYFSSSNLTNFTQTTSWSGATSAGMVGASWK